MHWGAPLLSGRHCTPHAPSSGERVNTTTSSIVSPGANSTFVGSTSCQGAISVLVKVSQPAVAATAAQQGPAAWSDPMRPWTSVMALNSIHSTPSVTSALPLITAVTVP
jgi:hypothetical protein